MIALTSCMVVMGLTGLFLPLAVETPSLAGKDANYILGFCLFVVSVTIGVMAKYIKDMQSITIELTRQQAESATKVADALNANTQVINECHRRTVRT